MMEEEMKKEVKKIAKEVFGKKVDEKTIGRLLETFKAEYMNGISKRLKEEYVLNVARHFTKLEAERIKRVKRYAGE